ncbi:MAG: tyrosine-type recombinase/integrase [bacterium]
MDLDSKRLFITKARVRGVVESPKTNSGRRIVDLSDEALVCFRRLRDLDLRLPQVFLDPRTEAPWKDDQAIRKRYWYPALDALGLRRRNPYQTRHTFASQLLMAGANPLYVANQMGHKDWGMIRLIYGRWIPSNESRWG